MTKFLKILAWIAGGLVVLGLVAIIALKLFFPVEKARTMAIQKASEALDRPVEIADVALSIWGGLGVKLQGVTIGNPPGVAGEPLLSAKDVDVKLKLLPLLGGNVRLAKFIINEPRIVMYKDSSGVDNFTFASLDTNLPPETRELTEGMSPETKAAGAAVSFDKLEINNGSFLYQNDSAQFAMAVPRFSLNTNLDNPRDGFYESSGKVELDSIHLMTNTLVPRLSAVLNYRVNYDMLAKHLTVDDADLALSGVRMNLSGDLYHAENAMRGKASLRTDEIAITDVLSTLPPERQQKLEQFRVSGDFALDADVDFDESRPGKAFLYNGTAVITDMLLSKRDIPGEFRLKRAIIDLKPDNITLGLQDGVFNGRPVKGNFILTNFADPNLNGNLAGFLDFAFLKPFVPALDRHDLAGEARFDITFAGRVKDPMSMDFSGDLEVENGKYAAPFLPEPIDLFTMDAFFDKKVVSIRNMTAKTKSSDLTFSGRLDNLLPWILADSVQAKEIHPGLDGQLAGQVDLAALNWLLPPQRQPSLAGRLEVDLAFAGSTSDLPNIRPRGKVTVANASYRDTVLPEPVQNMDLELRLSPDTVAVERLDIQFVSSDLSFTGKLSNPFPYLLPLKGLDRTKLTKPFFLFKLASQRFDTDKMFPEATPGSEEGEVVSLDSLPTIIVPDINGQGTCTFDTLIYSKVEFTKIVGKMKIADRKIEVYDVTGNAYTGQVAGRTTLDLNDFNNPHYTGEFRALNIEVNDFVERFTPFSGIVYGRFDLNGDYNAVGWEPEQFLQSLTVEGLGSIVEGKLVTKGALHQALSTAFEKFGGSIQPEQPLRNLTSKIKVEDGKVKVDGLKFAAGNIGDIELSGSYGMVTNEIGYDGSLLLSSEMTQNLLSSNLLGDVGKLISGAKTKRLRVPVSIGGTLENPKPTINVEGAMKDLTQSVAEGAKEKAKEEVQEKVQKEVQDKAGDLLQGLFKKKDTTK